MSASIVSSPKEIIPTITKVKVMRVTMKLIYQRKVNIINKDLLDINFDEIVNVAVNGYVQRTNSLIQVEQNTEHGQHSKT